MTRWGRLSRTILIRLFLAGLLLLLFMHLITQSMDYHPGQEKYKLYSVHSPHEASSALYSLENLTSVSPQVALKIQSIWSHELSQVTFQGSRSVTDQMIEAGGQPDRVILITKWRSGSTYVGSILRSRPGTYYFYEPLHTSYRKIIRGEPQVHEALLILRNLSQCQIQDRHIAKVDDPLAFFSRNAELWRIAKMGNIQWDPTLATLVCRRSPILAMKVVRLRLRHAEALLEDTKLNVKIIYLARDPRATMNSRLKARWCRKLPDCKNTSMLCFDLVDDYVTAKKLEGKYPDRFMELRYEDLLTRSETSNQLFQFLNISTASSSTRGASQLTKWTRELSGNMELLQNIQDSCAEAMGLWGYKSVQVLPASLVNILQSSAN